MFRWETNWTRLLNSVLLMTDSSDCKFTLAAHGGGEIHSRSVVLTTGTFLSGSLFMGPNSSPGGRMGDPPSCVGLSYSLKEILGLKVGRLRTGTPPRIIKDTIDFSCTEIRLPDEKPTPFSFINTHINCKVKIFTVLNDLWHTICKIAAVIHLYCTCATVLHNQIMCDSY